MYPSPCNNDQILHQRAICVNLLVCTGICEIGFLLAYELEIRKVFGDVGASNAHFSNALCITGYSIACC